MDRGGQKAVGHGLVHQRIGEETLGHFGAACLAHPLDVRQVGRAVTELVAARQRCSQGVDIEIEAALGSVIHQLVEQAGQARRGRIPVVQCGLERGRDIRCADRAGQVAVDDDQRAVATAFL